MNMLKKKRTHNWMSLKKKFTLKKNKIKRTSTYLQNKFLPQKLNCKLLMKQKSTREFVKLLLNATTIQSAAWKERKLVHSKKMLR